jgi:hypothetical protein
MLTDIRKTTYRSAHTSRRNGEDGRWAGIENAGSTVVHECSKSAVTKDKNGRSSRAIVPGTGTNHILQYVQYLVRS